MMNADPQGEMGQAEFQKICAAAGLICNKSDRDRAGWDFIVEFPFESGPSTAVETRQAPLSCHVQVKTLLEKNDRFKMRLSSAERLAKELKPAFVYVFKINDASEVTSAYLVHVLGTPLEKILKRLRKADATGRPAVNKVTISMSARADGTRVAATGQALREALAGAVGRDLHAYAERKLNELNTLGFEERPYSSRMTLHLSNREELVDVFLGIKKDVPFSDIYTEHERFGIVRSLPELSGKRGTISIRPDNIDTCTIAVRENQTSVPALFKGKVFVAPPALNVSAELRKIRLSTDLFSMTLSANLAQTRLSIESEIVDVLQTPTVWTAYWRLTCILASGEGIIKIKSDNHPVDVTFDIPGKIVTLDVEECRPWVSLCEQVSFLYRSIGLSNEPTLTMKSIAEKADKIGALYSLMHPEAGTVSLSIALTIEEGEASTIPSNFDVLCADVLELGGVTIGYCALVKMVRVSIEDRVEWRSESEALMGITQLRLFPQQYEEMITSAVNKSGCQNVVRFTSTA